MSNTMRRSPHVLSLYTDMALSQV